MMVERNILVEKTNSLAAIGKYAYDLEVSRVNDPVEEYDQKLLALNASMMKAVASGCVKEEMLKAGMVGKIGAALDMGNFTDVEIYLASLNFEYTNNFNSW